MSYWSEPNSGTALLSPDQGELVSLRVSVEPRSLEDFLEALAEVPFPINPEIHHQPQAAALVDFPAYSSRVDDVRAVLRRHGFNAASVEVVSMLTTISGH